MTSGYGSVSWKGTEERRGRHRRPQDADHRETDNRGRRSGRIAGAARGRGDLRLSWRRQHADAPGPDAVPGPDPDDPAASRAGRDLRGRGLCPGDGQAGCRDGDLGARAPEPRHRPGRRQARLDPAGRDHRAGAHARHRHRRVPGDADDRGLPGHHQAPLPGAECPRHRPGHEGGVPHRQLGPARAGPGRRAQGHPEHPGARPGLRRGDGPARLPAAAAAVAREDPRGRRRDRREQAADHLLRRRDPGVERRGRAPRVRHQDGHPGGHDRARAGVDPQRSLPVAEHAGDARDDLRQLRRQRRGPAAGARRPVRRSRHGQADRVRQARADRPRRHRRLGDQQEQVRPHPHRTPTPRPSWMRSTRSSARATGGPGTSRSTSGRPASP